MIAVISKAELNDLLKELEVKFVTAEVDSWRDKKISNEKGIEGGSVGPMTATSAYLNKNRSIEDDVNCKLAPISNSVVKTSYSTTYEIYLSRTTKRTLTFTWQMFPTYAHNKYDSGYQTYWYTVSCIDSKI